MRALHFLISLSLLLLTCSAFLQGGEPQWIEVRSEHFTVLTDAGEKNGRHVADLFEQMRSAFGVVFVRTKINQPVPLEIIAVRNTKEIRQYSPVFQGKVVEVAGFFQPGDDKNFIMVDMSQEDNWQTVFHEYAHLLLNGNFPETAPWFDEGFAEYLSTMKIKDGTVEIGNLIPDAALLDQASKFHLLDLFRVSHFSETYNRSGEHREMFYAESWLVAHYMFDTNQLSPTARYFLLTNRQKMPIPEAVQAAYGMSLPELEKTIWSNWRSGKLFAKRFPSKIPMTYSATVRPLDSLETRIQLADYQAHTIDHSSKAIQEYEDILRQDPNQAGAQRGLGYAYLRNQDMAKAGEHFRAAAKLASTDSRVYYYSAVLLQQSDPSASGSDDFIYDLQKAVQLDPQYADAYNLLAFGLMRKAKYSEAEQSARRAVELAPRNEIYQLNLCAALLNQQKREEAKTIAAGLIHSSNPAVAQNSQQMVDSISRYESFASGSHSSGPAVAVSEPTAARTASANSSATDSEPVVVIHDTDKRPMSFLNGKILSVDCSATPGAVLTVLAAGKTYQLHVADRDKLVLINAKQFSCDWKNVKAAANYRDAGNLQGDIVSLELP